jgi:membrane associated rhomboid family serine protease
MNHRRYTKRNLRRSFLSRFFGNLSITNWIILINVLIYIILTMTFPLVKVEVGGQTGLGFHPFVQENVALSYDNIMGGRIWTLLTSMFMHGSPTHLFVNMISLMFIGNFVERIIGRKRFTWFYLLSGIIAGLFFILFAILFQRDLAVGAVGASGAIFALGGLLAILTPKLPVLVFFIIPMPMWMAMLFLLFVLWGLSTWAGLPIGNTAHLGGLLAGVVFGIYLKKKYKKKVEMLNRMFR